MANFTNGMYWLSNMEIQRTYNWILSLEPPDSVKTAMDFLVSPADLSMNSLSIRCRSSSLPGRSFDVTTVKYMGRERFFPTSVHYTNPFILTFEEFEDKKIAKMLYRWQNLVAKSVLYNNEISAFTSKNCILHLINTKPEENIKTDTNSINFINAWPESVAEVPLSYAESSVVQYSLSLRYDSWDYLSVPAAHTAPPAAHPAPDDTCDTSRYAA